MIKHLRKFVEGLNDNHYANVNAFTSLESLFVCHCSLFISAQSRGMLSILLRILETIC